MKILSKFNDNERDTIAKDFTEADNKLTAAINKYNQSLAALKEELREAINSYNEAIQSAVELRDNVVNEMEEYIGERSEKWPDSEKGSAYIGAKEAWEQIELEEFNPELPDEIEAPDADVAADLLELPSETE